MSEDNKSVRRERKLKDEKWREKEERRENERKKQVVEKERKRKKSEGGKKEWNITARERTRMVKKKKNE